MGEKLVIDRDGGRSWCKCEQIRRAVEISGNFVQNGRVISIPTWWTERVQYHRRSSICSGRFLFDPRIPFAFQPVKPKILAKRKASQDTTVSEVHILCTSDCVLSCPPSRRKRKRSGNEVELVATFSYNLSQQAENFFHKNVWIPSRLSRASIIRKISRNSRRHSWRRVTRTRTARLRRKSLNWCC